MSMFYFLFAVLCNPSGQENEPPTQVPVPAPIPGQLPAPPSTTMPGPATAPALSQPPTPPGPGQPQLEELIQQSLWNLQQQEQHLLMQRQVSYHSCSGLGFTQVSASHKRVSQLNGTSPLCYQPHSTVYQLETQAIVLHMF